MAILESHRILIGACGWLHNNWQETFYPEDLPRDWYLGYYGNEYPVVSIRAQEWQQAGSVEEWLAETDELPVFICELPLSDCSENLLQQAEIYLHAARELGTRCVGIMCHVNNRVNIDELQELLQSCQSIAPTVLDMADMSQTAQSLITELKINPLWKTVDAVASNNGHIYVARLDSSQITLPGLRSCMENLLARQSEENTLILLIGGEPPELEVIKQARVMLDLL